MDLYLKQYTMDLSNALRHDESAGNGFIVNLSEKKNF